MIVRQFRLLLVAHQAAAEGLAAGEALRPFRVPDFVVRKLSAQAAKFQKDDLDRAYHQLLEIDVASKSGKDDLASALYRMVGEWGR
jgi:DNA polymerase III delta subunit